MFITGNSFPLLQAGEAKLEMLRWVIYGDMISVVWNRLLVYHEYQMIIDDLRIFWDDFSTSGKLFPTAGGSAEQ